MPTPDMAGVAPFADFEGLKRKINELIQKYNNLLVNLDSLNVVSLTADHVDAGTLDANKVTIKANDGSGAYYQFDTHGIVANNGSVNTLLFDLATGLLTVTSALIRSATGYPRVELNSASNLMGAYQNANQSVQILPFFNGAPALVFYDGTGGAKFIISDTPGNAGITSAGTTDISIQSAKNISLSAANNLKIEGLNGYSGTFRVVNSVDFVNGTYDTTNITVTKGIVTRVV